MSIVKIQDLSPEDVITQDNFTYYKATNLLFHLQSDFISTKPYGIPRKTEYCKPMNNVVLSNFLYLKMN